MNILNRQKLQICYKQQETKWSQRQLARWTKTESHLEKELPQSTISNILSNAEKLMRMTDVELDGKHNKGATLPQLEEALAKLVEEMEANDQPVSRLSLVTQGKIIARHMGIDVHR